MRHCVTDSQDRYAFQAVEMVCQGVVPCSCEVRRAFESRLGNDVRIDDVSVRIT